MRILLIEDDTALCAAVCSQLSLAGFASDACHSGDEGLAYLQSGFYDVCILDRMLPQQSGISLLRDARAQGITTPVLMLTALGRVEDRVEGLEAGADDYLTKPFDMRELLARVRALVRRPAGVEESGALLCGDATLYPERRQLCGPAGSTDLAKTECALLEVLFRNNGRLLHRSVLLGSVWGAHADVEDASLDSYIHFARRRLAAVGTGVKISTVRGAGYRLEATE